MRAIGKDGVASDLNLEHFKCYKVKTAIGTPKFARREVTLVDQFGETTVTVLKPEALCNPVDKNGEGVKDSDTHLTCYKIIPRSFSLKPEVLVANQFGENELTVVSRRTLCVPSAKTELE